MQEDDVRIRLTEEDSTVFEQARDYHNMMVRLIRQAWLYRFAGMGEPVAIKAVLCLFDEMKDMRTAVSRVGDGYDDAEVTSMVVNLWCGLLSTWNALFAAARGRFYKHRPEMI